MPPIDQNAANPFEPEGHKRKLLAAIERYRKEIPVFFHGGDTAPMLRKKFPGINYGQLLASIQKFESGEDGQPDLDRFRSIVFEADRLMAEYQATYRINADRGYCDLKYIYFTGFAYARALNEASQTAENELRGSPRAQSLEFASILILIILVGYLTEILLEDGVDKSLLRENLNRRIIDGQFEKDLGEFGCYLIYKCVSTTPKRIP